MPASQKPSVEIVLIPTNVQRILPYHTTPHHTIPCHSMPQHTLPPFPGQGHCILQMPSPTTAGQCLRPPRYRGRSWQNSMKTLACQICTEKIGGGSRTKALSIQVLGKYQIPKNVKIALYCNLLACYEVLKLNSYDLEGCYKACCKKDSNSLDLVPSPKQKKAGT